LNWLTARRTTAAGVSCSFCSRTVVR